MDTKPTTELRACGEPGLGLGTLVTRTTSTHSASHHYPHESQLGEMQTYPEFWIFQTRKIVFKLKRRGKGFVRSEP